MKCTYCPNIGPTRVICTIIHWIASNRADRVLRQEMPGFFRQIEQDRPRFEQRVGLDARSLMVGDDRHLGVRVEFQELGLELLLTEDVDRVHGIGQPHLLEGDVDLDDVWASHGVKVDHRRLRGCRIGMEHDMVDIAYPAVPAPPKFIGRSVPRLEDPPLLTGQGRFVADLAFPDQLHMRVVRSAHAHARIVAIDTEAALKAPGVAAVWTGRDLADLPPIGLREGLGAPANEVARLTPYLQPVLARERVRYVGEPVAVVFAEDPYLAEDAADLVDVMVEELPVRLAAEDPPGELTPGRDIEADTIRKGYGDVAAAFCHRARGRRARPVDRAPFRRAAGDPRRDRPP